MPVSPSRMPAQSPGWGAWAAQVKRTAASRSKPARSPPCTINSTLPRSRPSGLSALDWGLTRTRVPGRMRRTARSGTNTSPTSSTVSRHTTSPAMAPAQRRSCTRRFATMPSPCRRMRATLTPGGADGLVSAENSV